jgi:hypothetical protein
MPLLRIRWMCLPPASNNPTSFDVNDKRNSRLALQLQLLLALSSLVDGTAIANNDRQKKLSRDQEQSNRYY